MIKKGLLPNAYLFLGPYGVGKTLCAKLLAMALLCQEPGPTGGCTLCKVCKRSLEEKHPDLLILRPEAKVISIAQIKEIFHQISSGPYQGRMSIIILDHAELMSREAANSFLKTLEEGPKDTLFILEAPDENMVLPTIASRCQRLRFLPIDHPSLSSLLKRDLGLVDEEAQILAHIAKGSYKWARELWESGLFPLRTKFFAELIELLSLEISDLVMRAHGITEQYPNQGIGLMYLLDQMETWYRDALLGKLVDKPTFYNRDFSFQIYKFAEARSLEALVRSIFSILCAKKDLKNDINPSLVMENLMLELKRAEGDL